MRYYPQKSLDKFSLVRESVCKVSGQSQFEACTVTNLVKPMRLLLTGSPESTNNILNPVWLWLDRGLSERSGIVWVICKTSGTLLIQAVQTLLILRFYPARFEFELAQNFDFAFTAWRV